MRILVCTPHVPYPPRGGGRADIWRRIEAFTRLGHSVMLLHQYEAHGPRASTPDQLAEMDTVLAARYSYPVRRGLVRSLRQLAGIARLPWRIAKANATGADRREVDLAVTAFDPDLVWLDGPWLGELAARLQAESDVPIAYRSHNIEHLYLARQAKAATGLRSRLTLWISSLGLHGYERRLMDRSRRVFDISLDDLEQWRGEGVEHIDWLPPLPELALGGAPTESIASDVLFVGGLRYPNNVHGVTWLVEEVLPLVQAERPEVRVTVVGSGADADLRARLDAHPAVTAHHDVPSVNPYLFGARVLANPVSIGSGVQLKMLDMLMTDAPIVTRSLGVRGLPRTCTAEFIVRDDAASFARALIDHLDDPGVDRASRARARASFTIAAVERALATLGAD